MQPRILMLSAFLIVFAGLSPHANATTIGPTPYLSSADSPFTSIAFDFFFLEDFEDGALNSPGVVASKGVVRPPPVDDFTDSVDADDGVIDGSGVAGHSWHVFELVGGTQPPIPQSVTFSFSSSVLGSLPTHVGIVWTDGAIPVGTFEFEVTGASGTQSVFLGPHGDGDFHGGTAEDRFVGFVDLGGISALAVSSDLGGIEMDHLQYGFATVPEPSVLSLLGLGLAASMIRRLARARADSHSSCGRGALGQA